MHRGKTTRRRRGKTATCKPRREASGESNAPDAWTSNFQPPEVGDDQSLVVKPSSLCRPLLWQTWHTSTPRLCPPVHPQHGPRELVAPPRGHPVTPCPVPLCALHHLPFLGYVLRTRRPGPALHNKASRHCSQVAIIASIS